ncbi:hypothetical protein TN98_20585 [Pantoea anthophila]|nr:hypothetical protein TN98_20585 [Pantoea anthophila]
MYNDVVKAMSGARTFGEHISKLQSILDNSSFEPQLDSAIRKLIKQLMDYQQLAISQKTSSQKLRLDNTQIAICQQIYAYCQQRSASNEPAWMIAARNAGWTPPQTKS